MAFQISSLYTRLYEFMGPSSRLEQHMTSEILSKSNRRVLIASANPLFAAGLRRLYGHIWQKQGAEMRSADSMSATLSALDEWSPDLVIVDYDDRAMQREEFLSHFISGSRPMRVLMVSLQSSGEAVIYDRRAITPAQADTWLTNGWIESEEKLDTTRTNTKPEAPLEAEQQKRRKFELKGNAMHFSIVFVLFVSLTALIYFGMQWIGLLPEPAAVQATTIDQLFNAHFFMIALLFSLVFSFIIYSIIVFRQKPGDKSPGAFFKGNTTLEIVWTAIPLATVLLFAFVGSRNLAEARRVDPDALNVKVISSQWTWLFEYPDLGIRSRELYLPVDRQVLLRLTSRDVIHSFWVPEFRIKQDALPGDNLVKEMRITPNRIGSYTVMCAEMCGGAHADMVAPVHVVNQADFEKWSSGLVMKEVEEPAKRGELYMTSMECQVCHSSDGTRLTGPSFKGLFGSEVELTSGETVKADEAYLRQAIIAPNQQVVAGYAPNLHPGDYGKILTNEQVDDMIEFLKTLQ